MRTRPEPAGLPLLLILVGPRLQDIRGAGGMRAADRAIARSRVSTQPAVQLAVHSAPRIFEQLWVGAFQSTTGRSGLLRSVLTHAVNRADRLAFGGGGRLAARVGADDFAASTQLVYHCSRR